MITIISDIHDNLANLDKAIEWSKINNAEALLFLGDLTNSDTLNHLATSWIKDIYLIQGNCDLYDKHEVESFKQITDLGRHGEVVLLGSHKIGLCHEPQLLTGLLSKKPEIVFYGHTHVPWEEIKHGVRFVNPGNVAGVRHEATFASYNYDTRELLLHRLNDL